MILDHFPWAVSRHAAVPAGVHLAPCYVGGGGQVSLKRPSAKPVESPGFHHKKQLVNGCSSPQIWVGFKIPSSSPMSRCCVFGEGELHVQCFLCGYGCGHMDHEKRGMVGSCQMANGELETLVVASE